MKLNRTLISILFWIFILTACVNVAPPAAPTSMATKAPTIGFSPVSPSPFPTRTQFQTPTNTPTPEPQTPIWGLALEQILPGPELDRVDQAKPYWLRSYSAVSWAAVEPSEGARNWEALKKLDEELLAITDRQMQTVLSVRVTPVWAQKNPGYSCGPIKADKLEAFGSFFYDLVKRYSAPPYNVKYWEIWNEEDIDPVEFSLPHDSAFGCWGDQTDAYYGGGYYAEMLKVVYPQIKLADPQAQIMLGGLLLDCDPRPEAGCALVNHDPKPSMFLEGILRNGGGAFFDGLSFHAYDSYQGPEKYYGNPNWQSNWSTTGPVQTVKAEFIKGLLGKYGVSSKFQMATELALVCWSCTSYDAEFETIKSDYIAESYATAIAQGLRAAIWFSLKGWVRSGLINPDLTPLPGFSAFQFSNQELANSRWVRDISEYPGIKGYEFTRGSRRIWILWSVDGNSHMVPMPEEPAAIWDVVGAPVTPGKSLAVIAAPLYLEWSH